tara:strand:+ start:140 stop:331 length:192 start_codon:yes stop_codon:yes gene_type:complete
MSKFTNVLDRFEYEDLMQWDKDDLVHSIIDYQHQIGRISDLMGDMEEGALTVFEAIQTIKKVI